MLRACRLISKGWPAGNDLRKPPWRIAANGLRCAFAEKFNSWVRPLLEPGEIHRDASGHVVQQTQSIFIYLRQGHPKVIRRTPTKIFGPTAGIESRFARSAWIRACKG
jgi:hypothetical protein